MDILGHSIWLLIYRRDDSQDSWHGQKKKQLNFQSFWKWGFPSVLWFSFMKSFLHTFFKLASAHFLLVVNVYFINFYILITIFYIATILILSPWIHTNYISLTKFPHNVQCNLLLVFSNISISSPRILQLN